MPLKGKYVTFLWKLATKTNFAQMSRFTFIIYTLYNLRTISKCFGGKKRRATKLLAFCKYGQEPPLEPSLLLRIVSSFLGNNLREYYSPLCTQKLCRSFLALETKYIKDSNTLISRFKQTNRFVIKTQKRKQEQKKNVNSGKVLTWQIKNDRPEYH